MASKILFIISATILGIGLGCTPLQNYRLFNLIMEFLGSGGLFEMMLPSQIVKQTPVVGSVYGFYRTASRVYDSATPAGAIKEAVKGVILDCTPPAIKYPIPYTLLNLTSALKSEIKAFSEDISIPLSIKYSINSTPITVHLG